MTNPGYTYKPANLTRISMAGGKSEVSWTPAPEWGNPVGNVHGGYVALLVDDVAGMALLSIIGSGAPTVSLQVDYLNAMPMGRTYAARGEVIRAGKATTIVDVHVYDRDDLLVARWQVLLPTPDRMARTEESRGAHVTSGVPVEFSVSTWQQPMPPAPSPERALVLDRVVEIIDSWGDRRLRIAIDGLTAAGKTSLGHELGQGLSRRGRPVLRASLDDFKRPWSERHLHDRTSGEGYYCNVFDAETARRLLLDPSSSTADGLVALCSIDPLTQIDHSHVKSAMPPNGVLIVDGVFANRPEFNPYWDVRVWIEIDAEVSIQRGVERDAEMDGGAAEAERLHRDRYLVSELLYVNDVDPRSLVEVIIDNTDIDRPRLVRPAAPT